MYKQQNIFGQDTNVYTAQDEKPDCRRCMHKDTKICSPCHKTKNHVYYERHKSIYPTDEVKK